jgi:hypothetical protein
MITTYSSRSQRAAIDRRIARGVTRAQILITRPPPALLRRPRGHQRLTRPPAPTPPRATRRSPRPPPPDGTEDASRLGLAVQPGRCSEDRRGVAVHRFGTDEPERPADRIVAACRRTAGTRCRPHLRPGARGTGGWSRSPAGCRSSASLRPQTGIELDGFAWDATGRGGGPVRHRQTGAHRHVGDDHGTNLRGVRTAPTRRREDPISP